MAEVELNGVLVHGVDHFLLALDHWGDVLDDEHGLFIFVE
jgi:hypothetical protein